MVSGLRVKVSERCVKVAELHAKVSKLCIEVSWPRVAPRRNSVRHRAKLQSLPFSG